ncbi:DUF6510 family protein [Cryobacterium sp. PH31-AA6]|uniref:DUF6510 family protein n=1 Tax=Cryobacterium sp. PH31-AA6 TaxID=3046205 RepID=UPI0024B8F161|nr:DUF6510 family protein [Cryobacterium sp. PH31-AA6]MDJ0323241.1 DUF6510 family protein [Cryobacterium sp. PH31-AA6]
MIESHDGALMAAGNDDYLDGNAAAGPLSELFALDVTVARGQCEHCGAVAVLAGARWYPNSHGVILSCSICDGVLLRLVERDGRRWLDLRGLGFLEFGPG